MNKLNYFLIAILLAFATNVSAQWTQIGTDFIGDEDQDRAGSSISLSRDGSTVAYGAIGNRGASGSAFASGQVKVFKNIAGVWTQVGSDIFGNNGGDRFGYSICLNADGTKIAVGAKGNDDNGSGAGQVSIFEFDGTNWVQIGSSINGDAAYDRAGRSVSLNSDGTIVAVGADENDDGGDDAGQARVFQYNGTDWVQIGNDIDGQEENVNCGFSLSLNAAGDILAVGSSDSDHQAQSSGLVRVFKNISGTWTLIGNEINGKFANDGFGWNVDMNGEGNIFVAGGKNAGNKIGVARVYKLINGIWSQIGTDLIGDAQLSEFGYSVGINAEGTIITVGAQKQNTTNGNTSGQVNVYKFDNTDWVQVEGDILGDNAEDHFGYSVAVDASGSVVAAGAEGYDDGAAFVAGQVKVFKFVTDPFVLNNPMNIASCVGENINFTTDNHFALDYQWQLSINDGSSFNNLSEAGLYTGTTTNTLTITGVINPMDGWQYRCVVTNNNGTVTSAAATMTINATTAITTQPVSQENIVSGTNAVFSVVAEGSNLNFQWKKDGTYLTDGGNLSGATTNELTITSATASDAGTYTCEITGDCGNATSDDAVLSIAAGINDISNSTISIYPNPTNGILNLNFSKVSNFGKVEIINISGKIVKQLSISNKKSTINLENQHAGIYFIKIQTNKGLFINKIVKN